VPVHGPEELEGSEAHIGDSNDLPSASPALTEKPVCNPTTVATVANPLVVQPNSNGTLLTATISSNAPASVIASPSGTVTFTDQNGNMIGLPQSVNNGSASVAWTNPVPGTIYNILASYSGDGYFLPSTSSNGHVCAVPNAGTAYTGDYTVTMSPNPLNVTIGTPATATITVQSTTSYCGTINLSCSNMAPYSTCIMSPTQLTLDSTTAPKTVTLTVDSQASFQVARAKLRNNGVQLCALLGTPLLSLLCFGSFKRGRRVLRSAGVRSVVGLLLLAVVGAGVSACGSHQPVATPPGTYTVNIVTTGTGGVNHVTPVQMTFK